MNVLGGKPLSGAEFFSAGRFSEALNEYDVDNPLHQGEGGQAPVSPSQAVYAACNRAAAKLELEMCRSCLRDCDEAIRLDPYCLRAHVLKGQAYHRLGKASKAREAYEAGVMAGKTGGDVLLFVELVGALKQLSGGGGEAFAEPITVSAHPMMAVGVDNSGVIGSKSQSSYASRSVMMGTIDFLSAAARDEDDLLQEASSKFSSDDLSIDSGVVSDGATKSTTTPPAPPPLFPTNETSTMLLFAHASGEEELSQDVGNQVGGLTYDVSGLSTATAEGSIVTEGIATAAVEPTMAGESKHSDALSTDGGDIGPSIDGLSDVLDGPVGGQQPPQGEEEADAEGDGEGDAEGDGDGSGEDEGVVDDSEKSGAGGASAGATKKKKKKKRNKNKRNKSGRMTWSGEENEYGQRLTLRANKDGGGVTVEGLDQVLAASDISPLLLKAARGQLCHAVGDPDVDNLIALGYLQVNTGNYRKAVELFRGLLSIRPGLVGAHLGLGSALALLGGMENAVASFSAAIEADPTEPDCWKRRGQTRAAMGHAAGALSDLNKAVGLFNGRDADVIHQRGMVYHKLRCYKLALADFSEVTRSIIDSKVDWNMIGLCRGQLGEPEASEEAYRHALEIDSSFKEAWTNLGSLLRDWGRGEEALAAFDRALAIDSSYVHAYYLRGLCKHGMGDHKAAQVDFMRGLYYDSQDEHCRYMAALCMHARGQLDEAARCFDALLSLKPGHQAWYTRECCVYLWNNIRRTWREFSPDAELDPEFKEGWCKRHDPMTLKRYTRHRKPTGPAARVSVSDVQAPVMDSSTDAAEGRKPGPVEQVLRAARPIAPGIQLDCPGFLKNTRQHGMFGLAALEVAQLVRKHWDSLRSGGPGAMVPDFGSSTWRSPSPPGQDYRLGTEMYAALNHPIGYRDVFDVAVRWRQLSEPNDPVWWIDRLTPEAFREGFGLQTPIVNGQLKVIRYYPYYGMAIELMKKLMVEQSPLDDEKKTAISAPEAGLPELHGAVGHDHWVVTPCERVSRGPDSDDRIMEGTRLTIVASSPEGYEFTIRTPGTPDRWQQYDEELIAVWGRLTEAVCEDALSAENRRAGEEDDEREAKEDLICDLILQLFYYWVNFGPVSRGSAACGYTVLAGLMAAAGWRLVEPLPTDVQMDWEAILRPTPKAFMAKARPWLHRSRRREDMLDIPLVSDALPTALDAIRALNSF